MKRPLLIVSKVNGGSLKQLVKTTDTFLHCATKTK